MTEQVVEPSAAESPEGEGTEQVPTPESTPAADTEATWRNRLNGQTRATNEAIDRAKAAEERLKAYEAKEREAEMAGLSEVERLKAEKADAERRAQEAELKANDKYLNRVFPNARKDFPEIRDEVRLARLEAAFSEPTTEAEPDAARSMRAPKNSSPAASTEPPASKEVFAGLKGLSWDVLTKS